MLGRRGYALESVAARICREAGGRVRTNMFVRDMDLDVPVNDGRRLEVVVDGLPLHGGAQLAVDTTLVCALHADDHDEEQRARMGSRCGQPNARRSPHIRSWSAFTVEPSWWSWEWRSAEDGRMRHAPS